MRLLSRALFTIALLGGLAYGSYGFGRYVLSSHLFGPQGAGLKKNMGTAQAVTRPKSSDVTGAPRADIEVLPANRDDSSAPPPIESLESNRRASRSLPDSSAAATPSSGSATGSNSDLSITSENPLNSGTDSSLSSDENRPRRRRRKRRVNTASITPKTTASDATTGASDTANPGPDVPATRSDEPRVSAPDAAPEVSSDNSEPAPRVETRRPSRSTDSGTSNSGTSNTTSDNPPPRRRRERVRRTTPPRNETAPAPRVAPRTSTRSAPARRSDSSPVPVPEGSSGGDSPVPIPE